MNEAQIQRLAVELTRALDEAQSAFFKERTIIDAEMGDVSAVTVATAAAYGALIAAKVGLLQDLGLDRTSRNFLTLVFKFAVEQANAIGAHIDATVVEMPKPPDVPNRG